jgi:hypothetical protein
MSGVLRIKTTKEFGESTASKILDLVENSTSKNQNQSSLFPNLQGFIPRSSVPCARIGAPAAACAPDYGQAARVGHLGLQGANLPRYQLPLRARLSVSRSASLRASAAQAERAF